MLIFQQQQKIRKTTERVGSRTNECPTTGQKIYYIAEVLREGKPRGLVRFNLSMFKELTHTVVWFSTGV